MVLGLERRSNFRTIFWFLLINLGISVVVNYAYVILAPGIHSPLSRLFIHTALLSNVAMIYLVIAVLLGLATLAPRRSFIIFTLAVILMSALHMLNVLDIIIFRIFKYHINSMVLVLVLTEGAGDSLHLGWRTLATFSSIAGALVALEVWLIRICHTRLRLMPATRMVASVSLILAFVLIFSDKTTYAVSDLYNIKDVTRSTKVFPLYQRVTIKDFMQKNFGFRVDREDRISLRRDYTSLAYPVKPLEHKPMKQYPNIIWIVIDSWRFDMLSPEVTPNIFRFSRDALVFKNHHSGGNASRFGVFSLVYGVYGSYWQSFLAERQSPVLLDELEKLGYDFTILSSTSLTNPEFRKTAFVKLSRYINDALPGHGSEQRDPELARTFIQWISERKGDRPFYAFLFFDAPHGPSTYPREFEKYKPSNLSPNYVTTGKNDVVPLFNSYRNAILFDDFLVGKVLAEIKRRGLDRNSIILITGDHGEEYFENGFWGHTSAFTRYQTQVPLVLSVPGQAHCEVTSLTSHLDVVPTTLGLLGYTTPPELYSQGRPMLDGRGERFVVSAGWDDCAIIDKDHAIVLSLEAYNSGETEVRTAKDYRLVPDEKGVFNRNKGTLMTVMKAMGVFLK
ncbi:MAG: sulfatase-like hydrolase/transferase [Deltaproteobacteria bacterium]|nr:sulfatase-like hydrolase/transferase [Deltaproteobacteria bacterium]